MKKITKILSTIIIISILITNTLFSAFATTHDLTSRTKSDPITSSESINFYIINYSSLKYMQSGTIASGKNIYQKSYNILAGKYHFVKKSVISGIDYYNIVPIEDTSLRLDVQNASNSDGANLGLFVNNPPYASAQEYRFIANSDGTYYIMPRLSTTRVLTTTSDGENANIQLATKTNSDCQKWIIKRDKYILTYTNSPNTTTYSPSKAGRYALIHGTSPNFDDYPDTGSNCCNFVSQCIHTGGVNFNPISPTALITSKTDLNNWFTTKIVGSQFWTSETWSSSTSFYEHMTIKQEPYRIIRYQSAWDALCDYNYLISNLTMGDVWQFGNMDYLEHSMAIYNKTECSGTHNSVSQYVCPNQGNEELIYAQNSSDYINGHVYYTLFNYHNKNVVFYDMTKRF